ncbi:MAG TPA: hypothetical protein ENH82_12585 [bacterium]|nr:hypothetical protein [bacterium]
MRRRAFLSASSCTAAISALTGVGGCDKTSQTEKQKTSPVFDEKVRLAGRTLEELRDLYRNDLFEDYIPFVYKYVVDNEYGGFMCHTDRDGTNLSGRKRTWYEGRGIWVSSFLYNKLDPDPKHLEAARKSVEFILKNKPEGDRFWPQLMTREGKPTTWISRVYGDLFVATGLQEYSKAVKDDYYWDMAKDIMLKCMRMYDRPDYGKSVDGSEALSPPGKRYLGHWMIFIRLASQMLEFKTDPEVKAVIDRCIDAIMNHHYNTEYGLLNEELTHDLKRLPDKKYNSASLGHGIETLWMVMYEAHRRKDKDLFNLTAERFKHHVEVAWDDIYGGVFTGLNIETMVPSLSKVLWAQEEVLIGTMFIIEQTGASWAKDWYSKMYNYIRDKYPLKQYGYPLWILYGDRKVTFEEHAIRVGNFHHPRHLMLNLLSIERMIKHDGIV